MKFLLLLISLLGSVFLNAQDPDTNKYTIISVDTQTVSSSEPGEYFYKVHVNINGRDSVISVTYDPSTIGVGTVTGEPSFIEEYYMVLLFIGILVLIGLYQFLKKKDKKEEAEAEVIYVSKHFGEINKAMPEEFYETKADLYERKIDLSINLVSDRNINQENIERIEDYIDHLVINTSKITDAIHADYKQNGEVKNYVDHYLENAGNKDFADITGPTGQVFTKGEQVLSLLYLLRISFYPEKRDKVFAVLDYTIDDGSANYVLMVIMAKDNRMNFSTEIK